MPFKRKESEIKKEIKAYKFRIFPTYQKEDFEEDLKKEIFEEARLMNGLWNRLVELRKKTLEEYGEIFDEEVKKSVAEKEKMSARELRKISPAFRERVDQLWKTYEANIKAIENLPEIRDNISWEAREDVINRFESSHKKALKTGAEIKFIPGFIKQFHFPHRFSSGGLDANKIFSSRSKKISLEPVDQESYRDEKHQSRLRRVVSGRFGVGIGDRLQIPFRIVLHRQIPQDAKIKTAVLTGRYKNYSWEYYLVLTVDQPAAPVETDFKVNSMVAGLDLGWRKFDTYIRFGVLADSEGNLFEFRLPLNPGKTSDLRRLERLAAKHGEKIQEYPQTWEDIEKRQRKNDEALERTKELLREFNLPASEQIKPILDNLVKVKKSGLNRLLRALNSLDAGIEPTDDIPKAIKLLENWSTETIKTEKEINYTRERLINNRNHKYQNLTKWLKDNYSLVSYEGDLKLQDLAVKAAHVSLLEENGAILKNAAKYRTQVSLHEFLRWLKQKDSKDHPWLRAQQSAYSTTSCRICGSACQKTPKLKIICDNGHEEDQDVQAAINLRDVLADNFPLSGKTIAIPAQLKDILVPIER